MAEVKLATPRGEMPAYVAKDPGRVSSSSMTSPG